MFTDSHCHLDFKEFDKDRAALIKLCENANIKRFIVPGITAKTWPRVLELCQQFPQAFACLGLHPWWIEKATPQDLELLINLLDRKNVLALGEIGIDGAIDNIEKQTEYFVKQLNIAKDKDLPVIVHHRKSHHLIVPHLKKAKLDNGGVIHAFSGSYQQAMAYIDLGYKLGIGGTITYERASKTQKAVSKLPLASILLETDAPAMPLEGFQGQTNSPLQLPLVFKKLCQLREESVEDIQMQIEANVQQLFAIR